MLARSGKTIQAVSMQQFIQYFWGTIVRPRATFDALAAERTVRWAVILACLLVMEVWGHMEYHVAWGQSH